MAYHHEQSALECCSRVTAHDVIPFSETLKRLNWNNIKSVKTLLRYWEPNNRHHCHFQHAEYRTREPSTVLYSLSPLADLDYPANVIQ